MGIEQIVTNVKEKLGQTSLSDRSLTEYFKSVNPQGEPDDAFYATHVAILKSFGGQFSHDVAEWKKEYEKEHPVTPPATPPATPPTGGMSDDVKALFDKQQKTIDSLAALIAAQQKKESEGAIKAAAEEYGKTLNADKPALWKSAVQLTPIAENMTSEQYNAAVKTNYESLVAASGNGGQPYVSGGGAGSDESNKDIDDFFAAKFGTGEPSK